MRNILRLLSLVFSPRNIVSVGAYLCGLPFSLLGRLVPKKNIIVFGARNGKAYDWNSRYLYEYAVERNDPSFQCYWVTRSSDVYDFLSNQGRPVLRRFSWRGFVTMLQAQYAVISSSITDIDSNLLSGAIVIQTGHGLPVKKIGYGFLNHFSEGGFFQVLMYKLSCLATRIFDRQCRFDYVVSPSDEFVCRLIEDYRIDRDKIWITGMPRDDLFFQERPACEEKGRVLSFLPTHRYHLAGCSNQLKDLFGYGFDADRLQRLLEKLDCTFYLKFHHLHEGTEDIFRLFENHSRLKIYEGEDAMTLLLDTDVLISDYSSIFCNFLHLNRPSALAICWIIRPVRFA